MVNVKTIPGQKLFSLWASAIVSRVKFNTKSQQDSQNITKNIYQKKKEACNSATGIYQIKLS